MKEFEQGLKERQEYINQVLDAYLPLEEGAQQTVLKAMNYSVKAGGKRLRPIFLLECYRTFDKTGEEERIEPFLAAIEMLHTYSLVHDDLPAMDNDSYRRGKLTTHAAFGEAMGILAGDALLNYAFETVGKAFLDAEAMDWNMRVAKAFKVFAAKAGIYGMIGGQTVDVECTGKPLSEEEIEFIYELKTCALLEAAMLMGAVLGGAADAELSKVERLASCVGMAFQIRDDILDVTADEAKLGKPLHSDEANGKTTYVTLHGIPAAEEKVKELSGEAQKLAAEVSATEFLRELIGYLTEREF